MLTSPRMQIKKTLGSICLISLIIVTLYLPFFQTIQMQKNKKRPFQNAFRQISVVQMSKHYHDNTSNVCLCSLWVLAMERKMSPTRECIVVVVDYNAISGRENPTRQTRRFMTTPIVFLIDRPLTEINMFNMAQVYNRPYNQMIPWALVAMIVSQIA